MPYDQNFIENLPVNVGETPVLEAKGDDASVSMILRPLGTAGVLYIEAGQQVWVKNEAGVFTALEVLTYDSSPGDAVVNYLRIGPALTGNAPYISAGNGTDTNINLNLITKGTGRVTENGTKLLKEGKVVLGAAGSLTISGGQITATGSYHKVLTEAAAGTDDLDTILGGEDGMVLVLRAQNSTRTVVCKDGTGNLALAGDFSLTHQEDTIELIYDSSISAWLELGRSDNAT